MRRGNAQVWGAAAALLAAIGGRAQAQHITIDGTLSPARTLVGPSYTIGANLGKQVGGNLFQSFGAFGLSSGESATFTGPATVSNVIGRVTGGSASSINGAINSRIAGANVYLINPAGVIFGPNATINVSGSFRAATADYLKLSDGSRFQATNPGGSTLSAAAPAAFGFLNAAPPAITVNGSTLGVPQGQTLGLAGGTISVTGATLQAPAGKIHVTSVASAGEVPVAKGNGPATVTAHGTVNITQGSLLDVSDPANLGSGGSVFVRAGNLTIDNSEINGDNYGSASGGLVSLSADSSLAVTDNASVHAVAQSNGGGAAISLATGPLGAISISNSVVFTESVGTGPGGPISVTTGGLSLTNAGSITSETTSTGTGSSGAVAVNAATMTLAGGASLGSVTLGAGDAGPVTVNVTGPIMADGSATPSVQTAISSQALTGSTGDSGDVSVAAGSITLLGAGSIGTVTKGAGSSGNVVVNVAGALTMNGASVLDGFTGISSETETSTSGNAGSITVSAGSISLLTNGLISSTSFGAGSAGPISISTPGMLEIAANGADQVFAGVYSQAQSKTAGQASSIAIDAGALSISSGGTVSATTFGPSRGGDINISVSGLLAIDGSGSGIFAKALSHSTGDAGLVNVAAGDLTITDAGEISSSTSGAGNAGTVTVAAASALSIDGTGAVPQSFSTGIFATAGTGSIGNAGQVTVSAPTISIANQGTISSSTFNTGNAGQVFVSATNLSLAGVGTIGSSTFATGGGGQVSVTAIGSLSIGSGGEITAQTFGPGNAGAATINVLGTLTIDGTGSTSTFPSGIFAQSVPSKFSTYGNGGAINVEAGNIVLVNAGFISSSTFSNGNAGKVAVNADILSVTNLAEVTSLTSSSGNAGDISVAAQNVSLSNHGQISALSAGAGDAGAIEMTAQTLSVTSGGSINTNAAGSGNGGNISLEIGGMLTIDGKGGPLATTIVAQTFRTGNAGDITIGAGALSLLNGGTISTATFGKGTAGNIDVAVAGALTMDGDRNPNNGTSITSNSIIGASAGVIAISAGTLSMTDADISTSSFLGTASAGNITITVGGPMSMMDGSTLTADDASSVGNGGNISVAAGSLSLSQGSGMTALTLSSGNGGNIAVAVAGPVSLDDSALLTDALGGTGNAGAIRLNTGSLTLTSGSQIGTSNLSDGPGTGGDINIAATGDILLSGKHTLIDASSFSAGHAGSIAVAAANLTMQSGASISTQAATANGGDITLSIGDFLYLVSSKISTSVLGSTGNGGNITIDPELFVLNHSSVIAEAVEGHGGNITIIANNFLPSDDSIVSASSELGISGTVELIGPRVDLNGSLVVLPGDLRDAVQVLRTTCEAHGRPRSSLVDAGHGGLPQDTETTIPALYIANRDVVPAAAPVPRKATGRGVALPPLRETVHLTMGCG